LLFRLAGRLPTASPTNVTRYERVENIVWRPGTVDYRLRHEQGSTYPGWRDSWNARNASDNAVIKFMNDDRDSRAMVGIFA
jgi:hypothetical protein